MAFVYEKIDKARMQELLGVIPKHYALGMSPLQVIDRERDIVFVDLGGKGQLPPERGEPPTRYALLWNGNHILFEGYDTSSFPQGQTVAVINITQLSMPAVLKSQIAEVQEAIKQAMICYWAGRWERLATVTVQFPAAQFY